MTESLRVGFVGIGNMGRPMAKNLIAAGYPVQIYDVDPQRSAQFAKENGATAAATLAALGQNSDVVITMLPAGGDVRKALFGSGKDGIASGLASGSVVIDMSSSDPVGTREVGALLLKSGITLIDAPVSGLVPRAEAGTLTIMIGADDEAALTRVEPVLKRLGEKLIRIGTLGCGHAMKALNNIVSASAFIATAEALIVGKRFGLDPKVMTDVLSVSTGRSFHSGMTFPDHVFTRKFASGFSLGLLAKDVGIAADLSDALDAKTPLIDLVKQIWVEGRDDIGADQDNSAVVKRWERINNVVIES